MTNFFHPEEVYFQTLHWNSEFRYTGIYDSEREKHIFRFEKSKSNYFDLHSESSLSSFTHNHTIIQNITYLPFHTIIHSYIIHVCQHTISKQHNTDRLNRSLTSFR